MLTQTAGQPLYGKFSDLIDRKVSRNKVIVKVVFKSLLQIVLYTSMFVFCIGSLLSGTSKVRPHHLVLDYPSLILPQSITWLILSRALSGVGGGGIVSSVWTITSEIVPVHRRSHWSQALSVQSSLIHCMNVETEPASYSSPGHHLLSPVPYWVDYLVVRKLIVG